MRCRGERGEHEGGDDGDGKHAQYHQISPLRQIGMHQIRTLRLMMSATSAPRVGAGIHADLPKLTRALAP